MKLTDLKPRFVSHGGEGVSDKNGHPIPEQKGVGIAFDCPCGECGERAYLSFSNPLEGKKLQAAKPFWTRIGDSFETMSLTPSIQRRGKCRWHGYLTDGELKSV